jgi:hypothetical protein
MTGAGALLLAAVALCACKGDASGSLGSARPVVRASDGASATLTLIACPPPSLDRAQALGALIELITMHEEIVSARSGGSARLTINACPFGQPVASVEPPARRH